MQYDKVVSEYDVKADSIIKELFYALSPLYKKEFGDGQNITIHLFTMLHSTSESILGLLLHQAIFDVDVLLRTVMECIIGFLSGLLNDGKVKNEFCEFMMRLEVEYRLNLLEGTANKIL